MRRPKNRGQGERRPATMNEQEVTGQKTVAVFLVAVVALSPLFLVIFSRPAFILGIPQLYFYLFVVWALVILAIGVTVFRVESDVGEAGRSRRLYPRGEEDLGAGGER
jgi:hypothetical protein